MADKDGIATALIAAAWAAELKAAGRSLVEEWTDLQKAYGIFDTAQVSARYATVEEAEARIAEVVANPPDRLGGLAVIAEPLVGTPGVRLTSKGSAVWSSSGGSKSQTQKRLPAPTRIRMRANRLCRFGWSLYQRYRAQGKVLPGGLLAN